MGFVVRNSIPPKLVLLLKAKAISLGKSKDNAPKIQPLKPGEDESCLPFYFSSTKVIL